MQALSKVVHMDKLKILHDELSIEDLKTVHLQVPLNIDGMTREGYPILAKIFQSWLGAVTFELLEEGSSEVCETQIYTFVIFTRKSFEYFARFIKLWNLIFRWI